MDWLSNDDRASAPVGGGRIAQWTHPDGPSPRPSTRESIFDAVLALLIVGFPNKLLRGILAPSGVNVAMDVSKETLWIVGLITLVPMAVRRRYPLAALWVVVAELSFPRLPLTLPIAVAALVIGYSAAVYSPHRRLVWCGVAIGVLALWAGGATTMLPVSNNLTLLPLVLLVLGAAAVQGENVRKQGTESLALEQLNRERAQQETIRRAVEHERSRIARELHDVVTHNVSVMVVMAGAARKVLAADPDQATEALLAVEASGRAAMSELRQVMGLLTEDTQDREQLAPQPGLDQIGALVERIRQTGVPIAYTVSGTPRPLPPGLDLTAYRVVQEALTNTVKHAVGASVEVGIEYRPTELSLDISDTGGVPGQSAASGNGKGLIGLRERVAVHGGSVHAGRRLDGGYRVSVIIPFAPFPAEDIA
jgi:signal transduction histidine kinase